MESSRISNGRDILHALYCNICALNAVRIEYKFCDTTIYSNITLIFALVKII